MALRDVRSLAYEDVKSGDVVRWGSAGRWALVCEAEPGGSWRRLRWVFGADAGEWVPDDFGRAKAGWVRLRDNRHSIARQYGRVTAKATLDALDDRARLAGKLRVSAAELLEVQP